MSLLAYYSLYDYINYSTGLLHIVNLIGSVWLIQILHLLREMLKCILESL